MTDMSAIVRTAFQSGLVIIGPVTRRYAELLTPDALGFVEELAMRFGPRCKELLNIRIRRQEYFDAGGLPDFLPETRHVREGEWVLPACRRRCRTGAWRSPGRWIARW